MLRKWLRQRLGLRLAAVCFTLSIFIAVLVTSFQVYHLKQAGHEQAEQLFTQIEQSFIPALSDAMWTLDPIRTKAQLDALSHLPTVGTITLVDDSGHESVLEVHPIQHILGKRTYNLAISIDNQEFKLGTLKVAASRLPKYMIEGEYLYNELCSSSYNGHFSDEDTSLPHLICVPLQEGLFTHEEIKGQIPQSDKDVFVRQYLDPTKYEIIFFVKRCDPRDWLGFAAFQYSEDVNDGIYVSTVDFEMVYVKPQWRGEKVGDVIGRETARQIAGRRSFDPDFLEKYQIKKAEINLNAQCANRGGIAVFRRFTDNFEFMLCLEDKQFNPVPVVFDINNDA